MSNYTMFTAMPVNEFIELINVSIKETITNELKKTISLLNSQEEKLMTIEEAADFLHASLVSIHKWKKKKLIPFYRLGKKIYFKRNELLNAINLKKINHERLLSR